MGSLVRQSPGRKADHAFASSNKRMLHVMSRLRLISHPINCHGFHKARLSSVYSISLLLEMPRVDPRPDMISCSSRKSSTSFGTKTKCPDDETVRILLRRYRWAKDPRFVGGRWPRNRGTSFFELMAESRPVNKHPSLSLPDDLHAPSDPSFVVHRNGHRPRHPPHPVSSSSRRLPRYSILSTCCVFV
jgi:hypothetical protein